jgi:hypothetical protein
MQISLIKPEPLAPLPTESSRYVPVLQTLSGELKALETASDEAWSRMTPVMQFASRGKPEGPLRAETVKGWVRRVWTAVGERPVYVDLLRPNPEFPTLSSPGVSPLLEVIYAAARKRGMRFIPVAWLGPKFSTAHLQMVGAAAEHDGHGVAIRYRPMSAVFPTGVSLAGKLTDLLSRLGSEIALADLLIDLEFLPPEDDVDPVGVAAIIYELEEIGPWRSVVLLGTSIPSTMSCIEQDSLGPLPRREWELWSELVGRAESGRAPAFGDYGVQHPHPPHEPGGPGMRANIRYTAHRSTLVARGRSVMEEGTEQYRLLSRWLVENDAFAGADYSWGDAVISGCAAGEIEPGSQSMWRGAGTSHHLRFVTDQLREHQKAF